MEQARCVCALFGEDGGAFADIAWAWVAGSGSGGFAVEDSELIEVDVVAGDAYFAFVFCVMENNSS